MAKQKLEQPQREFTKHQLSRWEQQKRRHRIILFSGILIIVAVLAVVGAGYYFNEVKPLHETVIEVNDTKFDMEYYIKMLEFYLGGSVEQEEISDWVDMVTKSIEQNELIRQEAEKLGIIVSDAELDLELQSYDPPLSRDYSDPIRVQLLAEKLLDGYIDQQVPTYAEQRHIMAIFLESESQVSEVKARLEAGEDFATLASELSLDTTYKEEGGDLGWHPEGALTLKLGTSIFDDFAFSAEAGALSEPLPGEGKTKSVGYWLIRVVSRNDEAGTAQVQVMLLGSEWQANEAIATLEAGGDFGAMAGNISQHNESKANGGDFTVTSRDAVSSAFSEYVFDAETEIGVLSQPIRDDTVSTTGGYWLVKVAEIESDRQITDADRDLLKNDALTKWVESLFDKPENKVTSYLDDEKKAWAIAKLQESLLEESEN